MKNGHWRHCCSPLRSPHSPAAAQAPGITDTSIKLGTQAPMSGVVAMIGMVAEGQKLKFDAINAPAA